MIQVLWKLRSKINGRLNASRKLDIEPLLSQMKMCKRYIVRKTDSEKSFWCGQADPYRWSADKQR